MRIVIFIFVIAFAIVNTQDIEEDFVQQIYQEPQPILEQTQSQQPLQEQLQVQQSSQPRQYFAPGPLFTLEKLKTYRYELIGLGAILFYIICYFKGKRSNAEFIDAFYQQTQQYISENFAHIGFTKESNDEPFVGESANEALFYASGRANLQYMEINFNMRKRQDLVSLLVYEMIWPQKDMITIDIPVKADVPVVFLLSLKKKLKTYIEKHLDVKMLTGTFQINSLHHNYQILGEDTNTIDKIFDANVVKRVNQNPGLFMFIHYTDQKMFSSSTGGHLRVVLNGAYKDKVKYLTAMEVILRMVDTIAGLKLPQNVKTKALQARQVFNASKEKAVLESHKQQLKKKKQQKLRKQQAWLKSLPPEKQKKEDEKRKRKQLNKMMKGKTMKVM